MALAIEISEWVPEIRRSKMKIFIAIFYMVASVILTDYVTVI